MKNIIPFPDNYGHPVISFLQLFPPLETLILIYSGCHWLAMANSFANPVIYSLLNEGFRADLIRLFG